MRILLVLVMILVAPNGYGQTKVLIGRIIDEHFEPLSNASIQTMDSTITTRADDEGYFRIEVPATASKLVARYIGFETDTFNIEGKCHLNMILLGDMKIEFLTEEARKVDKKRKKDIKPLYKEAIKRGILEEGRPCS